MTTIHSIPEEERPRERLLRHGQEALSLADLLAILLGTGTRGKSVLLLAQEMLLQFGGLAGLLEASIEELKQVKGIGDAKAIQLKAAFGIAQRSVKDSLVAKPGLHTPDQAYAIAQQVIAHEKQEVLLVLLKDIKGRLIHQEKVSIGTLSEVLVHPREVFYPAVRHKAFSIIVAHNHPSGDPTPSQADLELTGVLLQSSRVMSIRLDDHLIVCPQSYVSLRERGVLGNIVRTY